MLERIALDMDGVLTDFVGRLCARWEKYYDTVSDEERRVLFPTRKHTISPDEITEWDIPQLMALRRWTTLENATAFTADAYATFVFWELMDPLPGAVQGAFELATLAREVVIVTDTPTGASFDGKRAWLNKHLPFLGRAKDVMITTKDKSLVDADLIIDDKMQTVERFVTPLDRRAILFGHPYNRYPPLRASLLGRAVRLETWPKIVAQVRAWSLESKAPTLPQADRSECVTDELPRVVRATGKSWMLRALGHK